MKVIGGRFLNENELRGLGLRSVGRDVLVHEAAILVDLDRISIGSNVRIDAFCVLSAAAGSLAIGSHVHVHAYAAVYAGAGVELCDFSGLSQGVRVYSVSDDYSGGSLTNSSIPSKYRHLTRGSVSIGRHVLVGPGSVILPGVTIEEGASVGAMSLVPRDLAAWGVYAGIPARRLKDRSRALLELESAFLREYEQH